MAMAKLSGDQFVWILATEKQTKTEVAFCFGRLVSAHMWGGRQRVLVQDHWIG